MAFKPEIEKLLASKLSFWDKLSFIEADSILNSALELCKPAGTLLTESEYNCLGLLIVKSGVLRVSIVSDEGREITLYRAAEGEVCIFSASCVLKHITLKINIHAERDCELLSVPSAVFLKIIENNVFAECFSYKTASARLSDIMWVMQQMLFRRLDSRLAAFLLEAVKLSGSDTIRMTHEMISSEVGSSREVITRMLRHFAEDGIVELMRGGLRIVNTEGLIKLI